MMQLKYLNFHKMLANFSMYLVGGFIPLIIYQKTGSVFWAVFYLFALYLINFIINQIFRNAFVKRPQLFLVLRAIPILIYSLSVLLIDVNFIWGVVLVTIFYAINLSFKGNSTEIIFNYSVSQNTSGKSFGMTRVFEQIGTIVAQISGALFLDYLNTYILIALAIGIYLVSTIPLLMYYISCRKQKGFNTEMTSNALQQFAQNEDKTAKGKKVTHRILFQYGLMYYLVAFLDGFNNLFNIYIYVKTGQFLYAGYFSAIYNGTYAIASYFVGYVSSKIDTTILSAVFMCVNAISIVLSVVIEITWVQMLLFGVIGLTYPFFSVFLIERMLAKTRILGVSNRAILLRDNVSVLGKMTVMIPALFGPLLLSFIAMCVALTGGGIYLPFSEETSRKTLVNYLEDNE